MITASLLESLPAFLSMGAGGGVGSDMGPPYPASNLSGVRGADAKLLRNGSAGKWRTPYSTDILFRQPSKRGIDALRIMPTPFRARIHLVFGRRSPPQVRGIAARRIITSMQGSVSHVGTRTPVYYQRDLICPVNNPANVELAVALPTQSTPGPLPAFIRTKTINFRPKTCSYLSVNRIYSEYSHIAVPSRCGQGRALLTQRFRPAFLSRITLCSQAGGVA